MKSQFKGLFFIAIAILCTVYLLSAQTPPLEGDWEVIQELTDEFEEGINTDKWFTRDPKWDGRFPSYFEPKNVSVEDGLLKLKCREINSQDKPPYSSSGKYTFATAAYKSKVKVRYGYFEVEAKASDSRYWNSFWFYDYTDTDWTEIDVYEIVAGKNYLVQSAHLFYARPEYEGTIDKHIKRQQEKWYPAGFLSEYHIYGLDWNKDYITWYVDGIKVFAAKNKYWHQELFVMFDAEVNTTWPALPDSTEVTYDIKYIRSWRKKIPSASEINSLTVNNCIIYPNPGSGIFNLNYSSAYMGEVNINVVTVEGKQINKLKLQKNETEFLHQIDLSNQNLGVYIIQIEAGDYFSNHQVIIK